MRARLGAFQLEQSVVSHDAVRRAPHELFRGFVDESYGCRGNIPVEAVEIAGFWLEQFSPLRPFGLEGFFLLAERPFG